jgi:hypothetical protein
LLIIFPSAITEVCNVFKVPSYLRDQSSLLAALVPWSLTAKEVAQNTIPISSNEWIHGNLSAELQKRIESSSETRKHLQTPLFSQGLRIHKFTLDIWDFLTRSPRLYCLWPNPSDGKPSDTGYETSALVAVLNACSAKNVGYKADVRVVFVHVGALPTFHKLPALAMRRCKQQEMRIYSYGTHPTVPSDRWGMREIFPIGAYECLVPLLHLFLSGMHTGGILTFSPRALWEDPLGAYRLVRLADQHPFWMSYIHPYVLAALVKRDYATVDPIPLVERSVYQCSIARCLLTLFVAANFFTRSSSS